MKKIIPLFLLAVSASSSLLLAQDNAQRVESTANCNNSDQDMSCYLMMDPLTIEEGTKAIGKAFGGNAVTAERVMIEGVGVRKNGVETTVSSSSSSNQVLRLRGGGPKKFQPTGGFKSTGDTSDEEDNITGNPDLDSEDTSPMNGQINKYLKEEIINNIYTECLAEVVKLSLGGRVTVENASQEVAEWAAAEKAAEHSKGQAGRALENARIETEEARRLADEAKQSAKEAARVPLQGSSAEQAVVATMNYEKARAAYAAADYEAKRRFGILAAARVETADNVLHAISVRNSKQKAIAEAELAEAKETEMQALEAVEAAKVDVVIKANLLNSAEANLNDAKKIVKGMSPASPMTSAQKVAIKGIEKYKTAAETAAASAIDAEFRANIAKGKIREMNFERELKAYHDAEEAWMQAGEGYKTALVKVHEVDLDDEELTAALASAEVHQTTWRAHARWVKARQADQIVDAPGVSLDHLIIAEAAWAHTIEGYKMGIEKSMQANLKCGELTDCLNNAVSAQKRVQAQAIALAKTKAAQAREQEVSANGEAFNVSWDRDAGGMEAKRIQRDAWKSVAFTSGQASKSWDKVSEILARGNLEGASLWWKVAEKDNVLAEKFKEGVIYCREFRHCNFTWKNKEHAMQLEKISWIAYYLSNADRWLAEFEEARKKGHQEIAEMWKKASVEAQEAAKYQERSCQVYDALGDRQEIIRCEKVAQALGGHYAYTYWACGSAVCLSHAAEYLTRAAEANDKGNSGVATLWTKGAEQMQYSSEYVRKVVQAHQLKSTEDPEYWQTTADYFYNSAIQLTLAAEVLEKGVVANIQGNQPLAEFCNKLVKQCQESAEHSRKSAEAKLSGNTAEEKRRNSIFTYSRQNTYTLKLAVQAFEQATVAIANRNETLAELWNKTTVLYEGSAEYHQKAAEAYSSGNDAEAKFWTSISSCENGLMAGGIKNLVSILEKATAATAQRNQPLADLYTTEAVLYQEGLTLSRKRKEAEIRGNKAEADRLGCFLSLVRLCGNEYFKSACTALEKATIAIDKGNQSLADCWNKFVAQYKELVEYERKVIEAKLSGNDAEADHWDKIRGFAQGSAKQLESAANNLEKAAEATGTGNRLIADLWRKLSTLDQELGESYRKAAEVETSGTCLESDRLDKIGKFARDSAVKLELAANYLKQATEATAKGNQFLAEDRRKAAAQKQELAEYYRKVAEAMLNKNNAEENRWKKIIRFAEESIEKLELVPNALMEATGATVKGNQPLADLWSKAATQYQKSAEYYRKSVETQLSSNAAEADHLEEIAYSAYKSAAALQNEAEELVKNESDEYSDGENES
ncbi:MAG: hypothetical protein A3F67_07375 [Verrucomicrobia bacterium RIFCSPHIGHO2_12_FULL_41_10]|nr:MAG: hypothetical protein A3F67_07375 [Verrucomicrobia bacterium RIFCSPHIGHO2_12_FULL_41_10]